eukprot:gene3554-7071_t
MSTITLFITFIVVSLSTEVRRVAIVGGLGLGACLKRIGSGVKDVVVFESRDSFLQAKLGGGVQLTGGAVMLESIGALPELEKISERLTNVRGRTVKGDYLLSLNISKAIQEDARKELCSQQGMGSPLSFSIMRDALQSILYKATQTVSNNINSLSKEQNDVRVTVRPKKKCVGITETANEVILSFSDGTEERGFDLVVGADGINSAIRKHLEKTDSNILYPFQSSQQQYSGIRITYCVTDSDPNFVLRRDPTLPPDSSCRGSFHQWFGNGLYSLCASYGGLNGPQHMVAAVYRDDTDASQGENVDWVGGNKDTRIALESRLLRAGFSPKANEEVFGLVSASSATATANRVFDLGVRDRLVPLSRWSSSSGRIILMGDSAHAMAPFLGQGANQALQDAFVLAQGIKNMHRLTTATGSSSSSSSSSALKTLAGDYERKRKLSTALLSAKSGFLGNLETLGGPLGMTVRNNFFRFTGASGIAKYVYLDGAKPNI